MAAMIAAAGKRQTADPGSVQGVLEEPQAKRVHVDSDPFENQQNDYTHN
jgi:hypothetical protein